MRHIRLTFPKPSILPTIFERLGILSFIFIASLPAAGITFTNNTAIGLGNSNYDLADIVVSNCIVTVDGPHVFNSVHVTSGGALTHSPDPSGNVLSNILVVTNEVQTLTGTNAVTLDHSNILEGSVQVTDLTGTNYYTNGVDYDLTNPDGVLTELQRTTNSSIPDGSSVLVDYEALEGTAQPGLTLTVTSNIIIDIGGSITAGGLGYGGGFGPGAGMSSTGSYQDGSGGGYGGSGGTSSSNALGGGAYGSFYTPASLGSGGGTSYAGAGGPGGGVIELVAGGGLTVNGLISADGANGTNNRSGGGAGGSVWLTAASISGTGTITANGGAAEGVHGGGGGGGRISVGYGTTSFAGSISAYGGTGATIGGAGTIYTAQSGQNGELLIDNGGQPGTNTTLAVSDNTVNVQIQGNAGVIATGAWQVGNLTVASNGFLLAQTQTEFYLTSPGLIAVEQGGAILANSAGSAAGVGQGAGHIYGVAPYYPCGGGGYGGNGASASMTNATGGTSYGSQPSPSGTGSGGGNDLPYSPGGAGGGAIQITSQNGVIDVEGAISANGGNGVGVGGGGGSGGTIVLTGGTLLGAGSITANGGSGAGSIGGGGGGGRIVLAPGGSLFAGKLAASGGGGGNWAGAGTIVFQVSGQTGQLILDNAGHSGANTPVQNASSSDLIVQNGAIASPSDGSLSYADLYLNPNGWLGFGVKGVSTINISLTGNATIQPGGGIIVDSQGYGSGQGFGGGGGHSGQFGSSTVFSGGGHGGPGGASIGNAAAGGSAYDSPTGPVDAGSGGGGSGSSIGGSGGGIIRLSVNNTLELDGLISANGGNGIGSAAGGGAGGAIWISAGNVAGAGAIIANGGNAYDSSGGGGGGGIIFVSCNNNYFSGAMTAYGGSGANWGGTGTAEIQTSGGYQLTLDNGGHSGPPTPVPNSSSFSLTVRNGATGLVASATTMGSLVIASNGVLLVSNSASAVTVTCSSVTVQSGGALVGDAMGYATGAGTGAGHSYSGSTNYPCGGGGHAGIGGNSVGGLALGGAAYDTVSNPNFPGSGGGGYTPYSVGGSGGGAIHLNISGLLQVDGTISANGGNGSGYGGGGGAGGSLLLTANTLAGGGLIAANGGAGAAGVGGGGAGGYVTISATVNQFSGAITAYGGAGAYPGGAGMVDTGAQIIVDNAGHGGAITPLQSSSGTLLVRNGAVGSSGMYGFGAGSLVVGSNASIIMSNNFTLSLSAATIQAGGSLIADGMGYAAGSGNGNGAGRSSSQSPDYPCGGGGHAGNGGNSAGNLAGGGGANDSETSPGWGGSGGGTYSPNSLGGAGGGVIHITVTGIFEVDGTISANGVSGAGSGGGGGGGGSISLTAGTLAGGGTIRANGGNGVDSMGGGGGGGIIVINPTVNNFSGQMTAYGGTGANAGGAGTVYITPYNQNPQLTIDGGGQSGSSTLLGAGLPTSAGLTLRNGATALATGSMTLGSLVVSSNSWLVISNNAGFSTVSLSSATIQAGGGISADLMGYTLGGGPGSGRYYGGINGAYGSGGGHGGNGGNSTGNLATGGLAYDSETSPSQAGSSGGTELTAAVGGAGGGAFAMSVTGLLQVDGVISASGGNGSGTGGGGGSGGSIKLTAGTLAGAGTIRANGGAGVGTIGGGGAGGIIAIFPTAYNFTGTICAWGGGGANAGGAGTIYTAISGQTPQFIIDNGGPSGAATPIDSLSSQTSIILRNGGTAFQQFPSQTFTTLTINSNGWLTANPAGGSYLGLVSMTLTGNASIQAGGGIVTDAQGSGANTGAGPGSSYGSSPYYPCGGGGYGGNGASVGGIASTGGRANGSITGPVANGSGGGAYGPSAGGSGGGSIKLTVNGTLSLDGTISANGGNGSGTGGGGGSGGSVWLVPGTITGAGLIEANGGSGAGSIGGGGGGGRIAMTYNVNNFVGRMSASGGGGSGWGGGGTIYTKTNSQSAGQIVIDNGGESGAGTALSSGFGTPSQPFNLIVQNGGATALVGLPSLPLLNNLTIASGGALTGPGSQTNLDLIVLNNVQIAAGGAIALDGEGYPEGTGPGSGQSAEFIGSGAGYGGMGGASSQLAGGISYGSTSQPVDLGSGGGAGDGPAAGGSAGGGALRLNVGGILNVDGAITSKGQAGIQDDSGGGSGGSIWLTARTLTGAGRIGADGGAGNPDSGGGGAGGRIAVYSRASAYSGVYSAAGGAGYAQGGIGTVVHSNLFPLLVLSNSPSGVISNPASSVTLYFNGAPNPNSISTADIGIITPYGPLSAGSLSLTMLTSSSYLVTFPAQTAIGTYIVAVSNVSDLYGQSLGQAYSGTFSVSLPAIEGTITDTNGQPIPGVILQATGGLSPAITDTNGNYALGFTSGSSFTVTPSLGNWIFAPASLSYTSATTTVVNQNYVGMPLAATLGAGAGGPNFLLTWQGLAGVRYEVLSSSNLINWTPFAGPFTGSNAPIQLAIALTNQPQQFFQLQSSP